MHPPENTSRPPGVNQGAAESDRLGKAIVVNDNASDIEAQPRLLIEARAETPLDALLSALIVDPRAQRALEDVFLRDTPPLIDRIAVAAEGRR